MSPSRQRYSPAKLPPGQRTMDVPISRRCSITSARIPRKLSAGITDTAPTTAYFLPFTPTEISAVTSFSTVKSNAMRFQSPRPFVVTVNSRSTRTFLPDLTRSTIGVSTGWSVPTTALKLCATPPRRPIPPWRIPASPFSSRHPITCDPRSFPRGIRLRAAWRVTLRPWA